MNTKKKAIKLHRELWDWLYHHPRKKKYDWPGWKMNGGIHPDVENDCFACKYMFTHTGCAFTALRMCEKHCPLVWPGGACYEGERLYYNWERAVTFSRIKKYAKLIRDLPERK